MFKKSCFILLIAIHVVTSSPLETGAYNEDLARYKMIAFAVSAYSDNPSSCTNNLGNNTIFIKQVTVGCDFVNDDTCSAYVAVDTESEAIIIAHRGSGGGIQIAMEVIETLFDEKEAFPAGGNVARYFYDAWALVWNGGLRDVFLTVRNSNPNYKVWITGHSLGGAMASLTAANIGYHGYSPKEKIMAITFGEPRLGDESYANAFDNLVGYSYRVVHRRDPVPHLPLMNMLNYTHTKEEIFYDNDMSPGSPYSVCSRSDDTKDCSNKHFNFDIRDHSLYFKHLDYYIDQNCLNL
uniref:Lipase_3 domain-containing protein n=1 Tax=Parastrongyloides trichosuri TaxID=131310 RepID=A0A0N4ZBW6_PARTI